jgi:hypothetical protein
MDKTQTIIDSKEKEKQDPILEKFTQLLKQLTFISIPIE